MKKAVLTLFRNYFFWLGVMLLQKPLFMLWYHRSFAGNSWRDWLAVLYHGLPLDLSLIHI